MDSEVEEAGTVLERTPVVLRALVAAVPPAWTACNEGGATWTPLDVVGHLIDGEETDWIPRARIILARGPSPTFEPFDRSRHLRMNRGKSIEDLLGTFERLRRRNVQTLRGFDLSKADLALCGIHPELGEVTLAQLLATWVVHDLDHLAQIVRTLAKQYGDAVGPWRAYLRVLQ